MFSHARVPYGGALMRSKLEVTWAEFFDDQGLAWEYEPVKFHRRYTPDFGLYQRAVFVEVKPASGGYRGLNNIWLCPHPLIVVRGIPGSAEISVHSVRHGGDVRARSWDSALADAYRYTQLDEPTHTEARP